jgi:hypothetical protein
MTSGAIDEYWTAQGCGLVPLLVRLVSRNDLDERSAYLLLEKPGGLK